MVNCYIEASDHGRVDPTTPRCAPSFHDSLPLDDSATLTTLPESSSTLCQSGDAVPQRSDNLFTESELLS